MSFTGYLEKKRLHPSTVAAYGLSIGRFSAWLKTEELSAAEFTYNDLLEFIRFLSAQGKSSRSIHQMTGILRHWCSYLVETGTREDNPASGLLVKGIIRQLPSHILGWEDLEELYQSYSLQLKVPLVSKVTAGLVIYQGLTTRELAHLKAKDIHLDQARVWIGGTDRTNGRWLALVACQMLQLGKYLRQYPHQAAPLLIRAARGKSPSPTQIQNRMQQILKQLRGLNPGVRNAVQIRSSVITHWLKGNNLRQVQYMAGHKYVSSTQRYQTSDLEDLSREVARHHPMS